MATLRDKYWFIEWEVVRAHRMEKIPLVVARLILQKEISESCRRHNTSEGIIVSINSVTAESMEHNKVLWFRKLEDRSIVINTTRYHPMRIEYFEAVEVSSLKNGRSSR
ncbi:hypothetical protein 2 [Bracoviriform demolitoris]|uniref:Uncharacterized protein E2 n=1 Tax=Microplitis demolitor bracovirus (isolate Webb) TaxID=654919 RepID=YE2_MDBVW|nr:hypothetical protein 2 [Bracoviriform demolitoris]Q5I162.1 RecName: Full=Uncharacterized protein E2 [Microplitis demolitor bracovirus (isolate Webb)]AAW51771.1 hypothetical protein 2 [Bracoviriform demolitoris]